MVQTIPDDVLAGESREWEYSMRRGMQEIIPGVFLGPYASARKNQVTNSHHLRQTCILTLTRCENLQRGTHALWGVGGALPVHCGLHAC